MREVKFRALLKGQHFKGWLYWEITDGFSSPRDTIDVDTLGEYTGLKDKNGKDVYEGDLIKWNFCSYHDDPLHSGKPMIVEWKDSGFNLEPITCDSYEVVGNIWES